MSRSNQVPAAIRGVGSGMMAPMTSPDTDRATTTLAVANQKGGVAKTTSVASLGAALAELGHSVLLVDLDPQACLTFSLGIDPEDVELSIHHVLTKGTHASEIVIETDDGVDLLPATIELARAEADLLTRTGREHVLKAALADLTDDETDGTHYDWVLLDCPPSLGVLTVAALTAADGVLIPLQCETLSHRGVGQLLDTVHDVRRFTNRDLEVWGVLPTLYDGRTNHARTVLETISETYDLDVIEPPIPKTIKFAEAPAAGRSILATSRSSKGAKAYREAATHLVERGPATRSARRARAEVSRHRATNVRPRYARMGAAVASLCVTLVAVLGGFGVLPVDSTLANASDDPSAGQRAGDSAPTAGQGAPEADAGTPDATQDKPKKSKGHSVGRLLREPGRPAARRDAAGGFRHRQARGLQREPPAGLAGRRRREGGAHLPRLRQRLRQPRTGGLQRLLAVRGCLGRRRLRQHEVLRPVHPGRHRRRHRLPRHPRQGRAAGPDRGPARYADQPRLHPPAAVRRDRAVGVRPARYVGDRHRLNQ